MDAPERRGFWDGVDLRLGAIMQTNARKRERERERETERERERERERESCEFFRPLKTQLN